MKYFFFFHFVLLYSFIYSQDDNLRPFDFEPYESYINTIQFIVLDINFDKGFVAFKHIYEIKGYEDYESEGIIDGPINCHYSGMEKNPFAGVILGIYDLNLQGYCDVLHIYQSVSNVEDCLSFDESEHNLELAKEYFINKELNIEKKPKPLSFIQNYDNNSLLLKPENILLKGSSERIFPELDGIYCIEKATLKAGNNVIYAVNQIDVPIMASGGKILFISAYRKGNKIIFLEHFHHNNNMEGAIDKEFFYFSKIYDISDF